MYKNSKALFLIVFVVCILISGCAPKEKPEDNISSIANAILQQDGKLLKKFNISGDDLHREMVETVANEYRMNSGYVFSMEQSRRVGEAYINLLKKVNVATKTISVDGGKATVEVTVGTINMDSIDLETIILKLANRISEDSSEKVILDECTKVIIEEINGLSITGEGKFKTTCTYDKKVKMWVPDDMEKFGSDLESTIMGL